jgi:hypothetical protein
MIIRGRCHCGNISFTLDWKPEPPEIQARACSCTFCRKHGGVWTSNPGGTLAVTIDDSSRVSQYQFGTETARFHVCTRCGIVPVVTSTIDAHLYAVVSVNAFEDIDPSWLRAATLSVDTEDEAARLARRKRNWIADVRFIERG